jgi:hypothetical protein
LPMWQGGQKLCLGWQKDVAKWSKVMSWDNKKIISHMRNGE